MLIVCLTGCGTVTPQPVQPRAASFDGNQQDSGLLNGGKPLPNGNFLITPHALARYNALIAKYGKTFLPPLAAAEGTIEQADGNFQIDAEHIADFARMNLAEKSAIKP